MYDGIMALLCFILAFSYCMDAVKEKDRRKAYWAIGWFIMWAFRVIDIITNV